MTSGGGDYCADEPRRRFLQLNSALSVRYKPTSSLHSAPPSELISVYQRVERHTAIAVRLVRPIATDVPRSRCGLAELSSPGCAESASITSKVENFSQPTDKSKHYCRKRNICDRPNQCQTDSIRTFAHGKQRCVCRALALLLLEMQSAEI